MTLQAVCDLSYAAQVDLITQQALAQVALAPHLSEGQQLPTVDEAITEFQEWLISTPPQIDAAPADLELIELLGVRG